MGILFLRSLLGIIFLTLVYLHLSKRNFGAIMAYVTQSSAIITILFISFLETNNIYLLFLVLLTLAVKVISAPLFFSNLVKKHKLSFSASTYLNTPLTFIVIAALTFLADSQKLFPLTNIVPANQKLLSLALSCILVSLFLIVNRKGVLSQIIGILSLENSIVAFVIFAGLEQSPGLQAGVLFNILIWITIATVFASMLYEHFGSHDVTSMKELKE